ncbi:tRNA threonylcarbamoyladenosine biosynthesis protein TsaB [Thermovibrio guaymasensis]|uniref:tRNA threonylcarbamoyladenosine biosynthesis protein TsaB n=1 Tax=Thermovibrio guaymasensis TaxID=240167 RepID=A0A420W864_9BACT|nr:tRNA (adenosine(37)-N6)-threonylcarbamoyltransferase complex dimerization subunit type 1 TsaB [Thermovibrio guaymasensis]RKQ63468.1 tRNA threonylcarbamoyladenosine biosynthesis protein TsaB [Thermovibrio guaymasensis]
MIRVAVDLSLPEGSIAVENEGSLLSEIAWNRPKLHAEVVYSQIERALNLAGVRKEEIEEVVVSSGPGSFTGVRLSVTVGKAFKACGIRVLSATTLDALMWGYEEIGFTPVPVIPARRERVYAKVGGEFLDVGLDELISKVKEITNPLIVYKGEVKVPQGIKSVEERTLLAVKLLSLPKEELSPLTFHYVREHDAKPPGKAF